MRSDGIVLKVDTSHKLAKLLRVRAAGAGVNSRHIKCVVTLFSEFEQVLVPVFSGDTVGTPAGCWVHPRFTVVTRMF